MGRRIRYFPSEHAYEIILRAREGIPFPCWRLIKLLLKSAMARASRGGRVVISHYVWMGNHLHIIVVVKNARCLMFFYTELQKRLTEYVKQLSGRKHLNMWEGRPEVAPILDLEEAKKRLVYTYTNPAKAGLVHSIREYPGLNSWKMFEKIDGQNSRTVENVPRIRIPSVPTLPSNNLSHSTDDRLTDALVNENSETDELVIDPNAWATCYSISDQELLQFNKSVIEMVMENEKQLKHTRDKAGIGVIGAQKLCSETFLKPHTPKKKGIKVFVLASDPEKRIRFIAEVKRITALCRELFKQGLFLNWPAGTFRPPGPPIANLIARW